MATCIHMCLRQHQTNVKLFNHSRALLTNWWYNCDRLCYKTTLPLLSSSHCFSVYSHKKLTLHKFHKLNICRNYSTGIFRLSLAKYSLFLPYCTFLRYSSSNYVTETSANKKESNKVPNDDTQKQKRFSNWTGKNVWKLGLVFLGVWLGASSFGLIYVWGSPEKDSNGCLIRDQFSNDLLVLAYIKRALHEATIYKQMIQDPSSEKLLPDPLEEPYFQPPYTLVLEMTGVLVHPDWTYSTGWRFKKRPNVDAFLQQIGPPLFEVVIYTSEQAYTAYPLIDNLDPQGFIMYRLFRDATRYINGHHVKDLSCLNRDLSKVIIVDWNADSVHLQPRNAVSVKKWMGNDDDKVLPDLANFLRTIAVTRVRDVREVLDYYNQFDDPVVAFRENQRKLQESQVQMAKVEEQKKSSYLSSLARRKL